MIDVSAESNSTLALIRQNYHAVLDRIHSAAHRSGRAADSVRLVAVTKYAELDWVQALVACGAVELGESRPQQLVDRAATIGGPVHWHLIGHLQRNKVRKVLPVAALIHSVDSVKLLRDIDRIAKELDLRPRVLLQVNLSRETTKGGFDETELIASWDELLACQAVQIEGLMTMAALSSRKEESRPTFSRLRLLRDRLALRSPATVSLSCLSMGMTGDFEVAIEEGATLVRIGSALWESLPRTA
jgi:pyridoxal phosphate enzyme (YggS family)